MILRNVFDSLPCGVFAEISPFLGDGVEAYLKIEAFNAAGSLKLKPARALVESLERDGTLRPGGVIIDTTSGNMGVALAIMAKRKGYGFVCVADEKITRHHRALIAAYGAEIVVMPRSTLDERFAYIRARLAENPVLVWTQQFLSKDNPRAHEETTAREILSQFAKVDYLFIGTGTAGTLVGCAKIFAEHAACTKIVAVDAVGSAHFAPRAGSGVRKIPGLGATQRSSFLDDAQIYKVMPVAELDTARACAELRDETGWLMGGSTGSVMAAARAMRGTFSRGDIVVCIAADMGERYLDSVYDVGWVTRELAGQSEAER